MAGIEIFNWNISNAEELEKALAEVWEGISLLMKKVKREIDKSMRAVYRAVKDALEGIDPLLRDAFTVDSLSDFREGVALYGRELAEALWGIQMDMDGLRAAIIRAASPIAAFFVPVVKQAIQVLTSLAYSIGKVLAALFGGTEGLDAFTGSANAAVSAGSALKRTLAGFDEINRLGSSGGSGIISGYITDMDGQMSDRIASITAVLFRFLEPLQAIDLTPAAEAFERLRQALEPITKALFEGLEWAWNNLFVPLAKWTVEDLLPVFLDSVTEALKGLDKIITALKPSFTWLWENFLKPLAAWAGDSVIQGLQTLTARLYGVGDSIGQNQGLVDSFIQSIDSAVYSLDDLNGKTSKYTQIMDLAVGVGNVFSISIDALTDPLGTAAKAMLGVDSAAGDLIGELWNVASTSTGVWGTIEAVWGAAWGWLEKELFQPLVQGTKNNVNSIIGFLNSIILAVAQAINMVVDSINQLSFTVPSWVPIIGGNYYGFNLKRVSAPQIPYLAQGAVLPANKPFLAMVGDQKHGTNIEAPLATIQEGLQTVLSSELGGVMAGFQAVTDRQERILEAILGIELSERAVAGAAERYRQKMAVVTGGQW